MVSAIPSLAEIPREDENTHPYTTTDAGEERRGAEKAWESKRT
jgi:hypothetical protein